VAIAEGAHFRGSVDMQRSKAAAAAAQPQAAKPAQAPAGQQPAQPQPVVAGR
jgi:hypothetical protein